MMAQIGDVLLLIGSTFIALGSLGLLRMPDVYNRLQAGTKSATLGTLAVLLGIGFHHPDWWAKLLVIAGFVLFTNPVGSSSIARASHLAGIKAWRTDKQTDSDS
jgi:multicomponent Na+:H+ antiporter subunit G